MEWIELTKRKEQNGTRPMSEHTLEPPTPRRPSECPVEDLLAFLGHRWNALVLWHLQEGQEAAQRTCGRFPGVSPKVLSERLQGLEGRGLLERCTMPVFPREVAYGLTHSGKALLHILDQLEIWSCQFDQGAVAGSGWPPAEPALPDAQEAFASR